MMSRIRSNPIARWLFSRPENPPNPIRLVTLVAYLLLVATPIGAVWGFWQVWSAREVDRCEQRVATINAIRGIWFGPNGVIAYLDETGADQSFLTGLTVRIEGAYPRITVDECLAGTA